MSIEAIKKLLGPKGFIDNAADMAAYVEEPRGRWAGHTPLVARPDTVADVAKVVEICQQSGLHITPQGGHTGLVDGGTPHGDDILLSLGRLNAIRDIDAAGFTMTVEAGCILADIQTATIEEDRLFPLSLAAEGSCQIGGNLSTNAGGVHVLRYGNARDLVLGLEVVLPDGRIWHGLNSLRKDNTGYDLKQLFLGAEGTLGIITAATLKLFPLPKRMSVAFVALPNVEAAITLLALAKESHGDTLNAFELVPRRAIDFVTRHLADCRDPMNTSYPWYALVELASSDSSSDTNGHMEQLLEQALGKNIISDAVIAQSDREQADLWRLREEISGIQKFEGGSIKHDVSVPIRYIPAFIEEASKAVEGMAPGIRPVPFGHIGDGNIHFNLSQPEGADSDAFLDQWEAINEVVHDIVHKFGGSISAEHGIGRAKVDELRRYKDPLSLELMGRLKNALDPANIMNPGRILPEDLSGGE
jgi:D-lactate dehydrogenase (cytochrome)